MRIHDISRPLSTDTPVWSGDEPFRLRWSGRIADGNLVNVSAIDTSTHIGTHVDAPLHVVDGGQSVDALPLDSFLGPARVVAVEPDERNLVQVAALGEIPLGEPPRLLLRTRSDLPRGGGSHPFPGIAGETADTLVAAGIKLVGIDTPGVDPADSEELSSHHCFAAGGVVWIENLDLSGVEPGVYELVALPLRLVGGDASPVRAILIERADTASSSKI